MKKTGTMLAGMVFFLFLLTVLPCVARAQDFYGEGNVLIAVDMGAYKENEDVSYPEGTMGTLV